MSRQHSVTLDLPDDVLLALGRAARAAGCSPSQLLCATLTAVLFPTERRRSGKEEMVRLALALATDWCDLQRRLRAEGCVLRAAPDRSLELRSWPVERPLLPLTALGYTRHALTLRFQADFPAVAKAAAPIAAGALPTALRSALPVLLPAPMPGAA